MKINNKAHRVKSTALVGLATLLFTGVSQATEVSYDLFKQYTGHYDYAVIGDTETTGDARDNGGCYSKGYSAADLNIPSGAQIKSAILYWSGSGSVDSRVKLNGQSVYAEKTFTTRIPGWNSVYYQSEADVTSMVRGKGNGQYKVTGLSWKRSGGYCQSNGSYGGFSLVVVYEKDSAAYSQINLYHGFSAFWNTKGRFAHTSYNLPGMNVPHQCTIDSHLTTVFWDADDYKDERFYIQGHNMGATIDGSTASNLSIDAYNITNFVTPGQSKLNLLMHSDFQNTRYGAAFEWSPMGLAVIKTRRCDEPDPKSSVLGDKVWFDDNKNGLLDNAEPGFSGISVGLFDANNNLLTETVSNNNGKYLFKNLAAGDYRICFDTSSLTGSYLITAPNQGNDEIDSDVDQSSGCTTLITLGRDQTDLSWDMGLVEVEQLGNIGDRVWLDTNENGQQDASETGIANIRVILRDENFNELGSMLTGSDGSYAFNDLPAAGYAVCFDPASFPANHQITQANVGDDGFDSDANADGCTDVFQLAAGASDNSRDLGLFDATPVNTAKIGDFVWLDSNGNGQQDDGEPGMAGIPISLYDKDGFELIASETDSNGNYLFKDLPAATYLICIDTNALNANQKPTLQNVGDDNLDSDLDANGCTDLIPLAENQEDLSWDIGIVEEQAPVLGSLGDTVWLDTDQDGLLNNGEIGAVGIDVSLYDADANLVGSTSTGPNGIYHFDELAEGQYTICFDSTSFPANHEITSKDAGDDSMDSDVNADGCTDLISLAAGANDMSNDLGLIEVVQPTLGALGDKAWLDSNKNGMQDNGEPGLNGIDIYLFDDNWTRLAFTRTANDGAYQFNDLDAGNYIICFDSTTFPADTEITVKNAGSDDSDSDANTDGCTDVIALAAGVTDLSNDLGLAPVSIITTGSINSVVWKDTDRNGGRSGDEPGIATVTSKLFDENRNLIAQGMSDGNGMYPYTDLPFGNYYVCFDSASFPANHMITAKDAAADNMDSDINSDGCSDLITITADNVDTSVELGLAPQPTAQYGTLNTKVWLDNDSNGLRSADEPGTADVMSWLFDANWNWIAEGSSDSNGLLQYADLAFGSYYVCYDTATFPANRKITTLNAGDDSIDSDMLSDGCSDLITLSVDTPEQRRDLGLAPVATKTKIGDLVWKDTNFNGLQDQGEAGIADVTAWLFDSSWGWIASTVTDYNGHYTLDVDAGDYYLCFDIEAIGYVMTTVRNAGDDAIDSDVFEDGCTDLFSISTGQQNLDLDMGVIDDIK